MKKILFYFGHPSQYLCFREAINRLQKKSFEVKIIIKSKDMLEELLKKSGHKYINIQPIERGNSRFKIIKSYLFRLKSSFQIIRKFKPDLLVGTDPLIAQIGFLMKIDRITVLEDDYLVIKQLADITYPFTQTILCPEVCDVGNWNNKKIGYYGYMKLGYLHPNIFKPSKKVLNKYNIDKNYAILRLSSLKAYHDFGESGISNELLNEIIVFLESKKIIVYISSEKPITGKFSKYKLSVDPNDFHHILNYSSLLICDSQSMAVEAAILGIPSVRISSFINRISVLNELEYNYQLTFGISPSDKEKILATIKLIINKKNFQNDFLIKKKKLLIEKIDVTAFFVWFIENYPESITILKEDPNYQYTFK